MARVNTKTTKVSSFESGAATTNFFFLTNSTCLRVGRVLAAVYNNYLSSQWFELILILLKVRKTIPKAISMLMSTNKKVSLKK